MYKTRNSLLCLITNERWTKYYPADHIADSPNTSDGDQHATEVRTRSYRAPITFHAGRANRCAGHRTIGDSTTSRQTVLLALCLHRNWYIIHGDTHSRLRPPLQRCRHAPFETSEIFIFLFTRYCHWRAPREQGHPSLRLSPFRAVFGPKPPTNRGPPTKTGSVFSRTLQFHYNVRLLSCLSLVVCRVNCDKITEVRITRFSRETSYL